MLVQATFEDAMSGRRARQPGGEICYDLASCLSFFAACLLSLCGHRPSRMRPPLRENGDSPPRFLHVLRRASTGSSLHFRATALYEMAIAVAPRLRGTSV